MPPALIADIAGGAYPAFMNILLALMDRDRNGVGRHLDIAMAENLFPFMYWAVGNAMAAGKWPGNGSDRVTGGSPRYRLYATKDKKFVAAAPLEQRFWETFCEILRLEPNFRDDARDPSGTTRRVAEIIAGDTSENWRRRFHGKDCCCTIVADLREALADPQFSAFSGICFAGRSPTRRGMKYRLCSVPILSGIPFRRQALPLRRAFGEHNEKFICDGSAVTVRAFGPIESIGIEDLPDPMPGAGEVVIDVVAAETNYPDLLVIEGKYQFKPPFPFSPGKAAAGFVAAIGPQVRGFFNRRPRASPMLNSGQPTPRR